MTTSINSQPYSYYNVLNGNSAAPSPAQAATSLQQELVPSPAAANSTGSTTGQSSNPVTPSSNSILSPQVKALLQGIVAPEQQTDTANNPVAALLGGGSASVSSLVTGQTQAGDDYLSSLVNAGSRVSTAQVYSSLLSAAYQSAAARTSGAVATNNAISDIFANTNAANLAYNAAIQQQTQTVLAANNFGPNGITPLTA